MIFTKVKVLSIITALSLFTNGVILSLHWNGAKELRASEKIVEIYKSKVEEFQKQTHDLEKLALGQNSDIKLLINRIKDLQTSTKELNKEIDNYYIEREKEQKEANIISNTINSATKEMTIANSEIATANIDAVNHHSTIKSLLNGSEIGTVKNIERIDIKEYIKTPSKVNENIARLNVHTRNLDDYKKVLFDKWFNSIKINNDSIKGISSVDVFLSPDGYVGIFPCYKGCNANFNKFKNCFKNKKFMTLPLIIKKAR